MSKATRAASGQTDCEFEISSFEVVHLEDLADTCRTGSEHVSKQKGSIAWSADMLAEPDGTRLKFMMQRVTEEVFAKRSLFRTGYSCTEVRLVREDAGWAGILHETKNCVLIFDWMTLDPRMFLEAGIAWHWFG
jgi:hypothetical protein